MKSPPSGQIAVAMPGLQAMAPFSIVGKLPGAQLLVQIRPLTGLVSM
jgi:hypothetical protein